MEIDRETGVAGTTDEVILRSLSEESYREDIYARMERDNAGAYEFIQRAISCQPEFEPLLLAAYSLGELAKSAREYTSG